MGYDVNMITKTVTVPSPAKLNLFLHIVGKRDDGYHNLQSLFQFVDICDTMTLQANDSNKVQLTTEISGVRHDDNLIVKAAKLLKRHTKSRLGCNIAINKILPMGGGLGGGSSNAATTLLVLNHLWQTELPLKELAALGLSLGADVPIFIHGFAAFAEGVGEILTPLSPAESWYLISNTNTSVSTAKVFSHPELPRDTAPVNIEKLDLSVSKNDFENLVLKLHPEVANLMSWLLEYAPSKMTGSGACIFSQFASSEEAKQVQAKLPKNIQSFVAKGCNISPLHSVMNAW